MELANSAKQQQSSLTMAEAMLQDGYKSSHSSLRSIDDDSDKKEIVSSLKRKDPPQNSNGDEMGDGNKRVLPRQRSVVIQVPVKQHKISSPFTPRELVDGLNNSMSPDERLDAIYKAISTLDHDDSELHSLEIDACTDIALVKMLAYLEFKSGFRKTPTNQEDITKEISLTFQALEMVYRAPSDSVETSFKRVGTDLLHILVVLLEQEVQSRMKAHCPTVSPTLSALSGNEGEEKGELNSTMDNEVIGNWDRDVLLRKACKIIGHFARVGYATRPVAHYPGLLSTIIALINVQPHDLVPWEARLSCLWAIANLACNTDNMMMMISTPGLVDTLINVGRGQVNPPEPLEQTMGILRSKSIASRALLNLSWPAENKLLMAENIALVDTLCHLAVQRTSPYQKSKTMQEILLKTRRHTVGTIRNLAAAPRKAKIGLCEALNGKLLETLTDVAMAETDAETVDLALAAIHNLAVHETAKYLVAKTALVDSVKKHVSSEPKVKDPTQPMSHASSILLVLERSIPPEMANGEKMKNFIDTMPPEELSDKDKSKTQATVVV
eukprot:Nitzschia sp. Nitz4//scaffold161_size51353//2757//4489//NITZ4_006939-RA/size51353-processed-gene-0.43-mRNA-1//1//CDS//3329537882//5736//frame0